MSEERIGEVVLLVLLAFRILGNFKFFSKYYQFIMKVIEILPILGEILESLKKIANKANYVKAVEIINKISPVLFKAAEDAQRMEEIENKKEYFLSKIVEILKQNNITINQDILDYAELVTKALHEELRKKKNVTEVPSASKLSLIEKILTPISKLVLFVLGIKS